MSCQTVQKFISERLDQRLGAEQQERIARHLAICRECATHAAQVQHVRTMLQSLPVAAPPPDVVARLRVVASHERARRLARVDLSTRLEHWADRFHLFINNLMRPVALPLAGGLVSALFLFSMLVPSLLFQINFHNDVPVSAFYTEAALVEAAPFNFTYEDAVVELTINEKGVVTDYSFPSGKLDRNAESNLIANLVLFSRYIPATLFGQPTTSKILVPFRRSRIVVRG